MFCRMMASVRRECRDEPGQLREVVGHERDVGRLDVPTSRPGGAHRDADGGPGQGGRIVHAVAHHGHRARGARRGPPPRHLVLREELRLHLVDAESRAIRSAVSRLSPVSMTSLDHAGAPEPRAPPSPRAGPRRRAR